MPIRLQVPNFDFDLAYVDQFQVLAHGRSK